MKILCLIVCLLVLLVATPCYAEETVEDVPGILSMTTAQVLSFLPVNSFAKYYTHHPVQGTVFTALQAIGIGALVVGIIDAASDSRSDVASPEALMAIGGVAWFTPWLYTAITTPGDVRSYNEEVIERHNRSFQPALSVTDERVHLSVRFGF